MSDIWESVDDWELEGCQENSELCCSDDCELLGSLSDIWELVVWECWELATWTNIEYFRRWVFWYRKQPPTQNNRNMVPLLFPPPHQVLQPLIANVIIFNHQCTKSCHTDLLTRHTSSCSSSGVVVININISHPVRRCPSSQPKYKMKCSAQPKPNGQSRMLRGKAEDCCLFC